MIKTLFDFNDPSAAKALHAIDDRVMGDISRSTLHHDPAGHAVFEGGRLAGTQRWLRFCSIQPGRKGPVWRQDLPDRSAR